MIDVDLVCFLRDNHTGLLGLPVLGDLKEISLLYAIDKEYREGNTPGYTFDRFFEAMETISEAAPGALVFKKDVWAARALEFIDKNVLERLNLVIATPYVGWKCVLAPEEKPRPLLERLFNLLDHEQIESLTRQDLLHQLQCYLKVAPASLQLGKEKIRNTAPITEYIPICSNRQHTVLLASYVHVVNNKIVSLQSAKLPQVDSYSPHFTECLQSKIHYVPNLKPQTDLSLGDCSYLDTCHKLNTCRYVHYLQYVPESLKATVSAEANRLNLRLSSQRSIPFYIHGDCCSDVVKSQLPEQWIQCDVRKFDFSVLGKFSAVIADPAWNIHMNLPYGTCNDMELLDLPLNQLQDEGILFLWVTGRAIELGKESLQKWGYEVMHEISWIKTNQLGRTIVTGRTGHWLNHSKEHLLVGLKGHPSWINKRLDTDLIVSSTRETSRKPDELYGLIERLVGPHARKLEIFGRDHNVRPGWFTIGNQLTGTSIHETDVKIRYHNFVSKPSHHEGDLARRTTQIKTERTSGRRSSNRTKAEKW